MRTLQFLWHPVKKFSKGMLALFTVNLLIVGCIFIFDSCKKSEYMNSFDSKAKTKFLAALEANKKTIASVSFANQINSQTALRSSVAGTSQRSTNYETIYLDFPSGTDNETRNLIFNTSSVQELSNLIDYSNAVVQYDPTSTNFNYQLQVPFENVVSSLNPLVGEAKQYLYAKGFTDHDIQDMLIQEGGKEEDLIPFVMALTQAENSQPVARNYTNFFITSAHAKLDANDYIRCAAIAIGADVLWALGGSSASAWTVPAMKKAFGAVAKRMLGPIGVAIAVVSFGVCIAEAYYD
jgi:hypothetical protein